jgi:alkylation response protein AidB-like acyl-CoA dehydrogenase
VSTDVKPDLDEHQQLLATTTRRFLESSVPMTSARDRFDDVIGFDRGWWCDAAGLGWTSMLGVGSDRSAVPGLAELVVVAEEMGRVVAPGPLVPTNVVSLAIDRSGSDQARWEFLDGLHSGSLIGSWAFAEQSGVWDTESMTATAERAPDGSYVVTGVKHFVEAGDDADVILVVAADGAAPVQVLVTPDDVGVGIVTQDSIDPARRFAIVELDQVLVPPERVLDTASTRDDIDVQLDVALVLQCAGMAGAAARAFEITLAWAFDRYSFGRQLASYQVIKHRFADMKLALEACLGAATGASDKVTAGDRDASEVTSVANAYIGERAPEIIQECVQLHGGIGVTWEHDLHLFLRRVILDRALYGAPQSQLARIARELGL